MSEAVRTRRSQRRLDYKVFHATGEKVYKEAHSPASDDQENTSVDSSFMDDSTMAADNESVLIIQADALSDDIDDFLDENPVEEICDSIKDLDMAINKAEELRSIYRGKHKELQALMNSRYEDIVGDQCEKKLLSIKNYVLRAKKFRRGITNDEMQSKKDEKDLKKKSFSFLVADQKRQMLQLETALGRAFGEVEDKEVVRRKEELPEMMKIIEAISGKFTEIVSYSSPGTDDDDTIEEIKKRYEKISALKEIYVFHLNNEIGERELNKQDVFNEANLNIKLPKFKGYGSTTDIYTFQSEFEKLHLRTTPRRLLPDLLKNNFLEDSALSLVKSVEDIDDIWKRLKEAFGDPKVMMNIKFTEINNIAFLLRSRDAEKISNGLNKVINLMKDLMNLTKVHKIEEKLYHGDGLERIFKLVGESRVTRWLSQNCGQDLDSKVSWESLIDFLEKDWKIQQQKLMIYGKGNISKIHSTEGAVENRTQKHYSHIAANGGESAEKEANDIKKLHLNSGEKAEKNLRCHICGEFGHVQTLGPKYSKHIQYFTCKRFVEMNPGERFEELRMKQLCFQCLLPGATVNEEKHKKGRCQRDFVCKHPSHQRYPRKKHVLVCDEHKDTQENKDLLEEYKSRCILKEKIANLPSYSKEIKLSFYAEERTDLLKSDAHVSLATEEKAIYQLQTIMIADTRYSVFFDSGCSDFVSRHRAVMHLGNKAVQECPGPIQLSGVGGVTTVSPYGIYTVKLPLINGEEAQLSGICLDEITGAFSEYPLKGKVEDDIHEAYALAGGDVKSLPKLPNYVGGEIDFLIGIKYLRYHPEIVFQLPSGLTIYKSVFENADGGRGVIGGPHEIFSAIDNHFQFSQSHHSTFLCNQRELYRNGYQVNPDMSLLGYSDSWDGIHQLSQESENHVGDALLSRNQKLFNAAEMLGSEITYRCVKCRSCKSCKECNQTEAVSIREEVEEELIKNSVTIDVANRTATATLPLINDPTVKLAPNRNKAMKVYTQQLRKLHHNPKDKAEVLKSEGKLHSLGYVDYVRNLSAEHQDMLRKNPIQNYIPWRVVWKGSSVTTPCRVVFDASQDTGSGYSLNDVLAKGRNNMNKMQEILIRWSVHKVGFHTDVQKMYNCVNLKESDWCFQRYLWQEELDIQKSPEEKVIKTLIYGVKPSGNLAERSIRETARLSMEEYPEINEIVNKDIYVDDCLSGENSVNAAAVRTDQLEIVLNKGGFSLKGVAFSGKDPPESLSEDGVSIVVTGIRWYTRDDLISLNVGKLNFTKKRRGRKDDDGSKIPEKLTKRHCASKVAEIFDILGKLTPITIELKLDLHELVLRKLDWDDAIPDNLRPLWKHHFELMQEINSLKYSRAIVPADAVNLDINTIDFGDASQAAACVAIYARFKRSNGDYSCQLVLSRSRLVPEGMSQPRAELYAAVLNTHSGEVVKKAFYKYHQHAHKLTDSQIVLHWINNEERPLKQWVRNRVLEVRRFTEPEDWSYVDSKNMLADMGTRRGSKLADVSQESVWINGLEWMKKEISLFPVKSVHQLTLHTDDIQEMKKEVPFNHDYDQRSDVRRTVHNCVVVSRNLPGEVEERYRFSRYVIDPNRRNFKTVVRITAYVFKFIKILIRRIRDDVKQVNVSGDVDAALCLVDDADLKKAEDYFFRKATLEVKHFMKDKQYKKISEEKNGVLLYTGRILEGDEVTIVTPMTSTMHDLASTTFCVPVVDRHSPIAYAIVNDVHWNDKTVRHSGIETMWRYVLKYAFIIEGRELVKMIKKSCERCRYLAKRTIEVAMGPVSQYNITVAPAFYITQVDLAGPFKSYSGHNKRAALKIWLVVFCCATTSTTSIKVMDDYSSTAFIQSFVRLSCDVGYPKMLLADGGSQLVKSFDSIKLNYQDLKFRLHKDKGVEFELCPVGGHNMNGKVERKIREIKGSLEKCIVNERLSILQWETVASEISNSINDLPLALGNLTSDFESMDLITPNRLKLGRNNDRSPVGSLEVTNNQTRILDSNQRIYKSWFEHWLLCHVPKLIPQPKWFKSDQHLAKGDVVLFRKHESIISSTYQYGMVESVECSRDGVIRKAKIKYRNHNENVDRVTYRSVRQLVVIHSVDELGILQELGEVANVADYKLKLEMQNNAQ